jgi:hypothetical protein
MESIVFAPDLIVMSRPAVYRLIAAAAIGALLLPTIAWILSDRHLWQWDQSYYGAATLDLCNTHGGAAWLRAMVSALRSMPPMLVWTAQFLVPLHHITPDVESAMLLVNVVFTAGILALTYATARRLECGLAASLSGVVLVGGSTDIIGLSHEYLVEVSQAFAVTMMLFIAWRVERLSWVRCAAFLVIGISLTQAAKASSFIFTLPPLAYCALVLGATWKRERPVPTAFDFAWLAVALAFLALTAAWYWVNWDYMMAHFIFSTVASAELMAEGPVVDLRQTIPFWISNMSVGISAIDVIPISAFAAVFVALVVGLRRSAAGQLLTTCDRAIKNWTLFGLTLAGTIVLVILAYSLQLNVDSRFLTPLVPFAGVLVAWSLSVLRVRWLSVAFLGIFVVNAAANHALSFGRNPGRLISNAWLQPTDRDLGNRDRLAAIVAATCTPEAAGRWIVLAVNYPSLNGNSANFFAAKDPSTLGHRCSYINFPIFETDIDKDFAFIFDIARAYYVVTLEPSKQQTTPDWINRLAKPIAERLARDDRFVLRTTLGDILIYQPRS